MAKTIKVRVLVATWADADGAHYEASGWSLATDDCLKRSCTQTIPSEDVVRRFTWVTARVPLPEEPGTVEAEVER